MIARGELIMNRFGLSVRSALIALILASPMNLSQATPGIDLYIERAREMISEAEARGDTETYFIVSVVGILKTGSAEFSEQDLRDLARASGAAERALSRSSGVPERDVLRNAILDRLLRQQVLGNVYSEEPYAACRERIDPKTCQRIAATAARIYASRPGKFVLFGRPISPPKSPSRWASPVWVGAVALAAALSAGIIFWKYAKRRR